MSELRKTGFNIDVAKSMVIGRNDIDQSVHMVRKNIFYISRMKVKNQFQNDMLTEKVQEDIKRRIEPGPAIVPDPNFVVSHKRKKSKTSQVRDLRNQVKKYLAASPRSPSNEVATSQNFERVQAPSSYLNNTIDHQTLSQRSTNHRKRLSIGNLKSKSTLAGAKN